MSLFSRQEDLPGEHGVIRDCTPTGKGRKGLSRLERGDIAVIDETDLSRKLAQQLIDAHPLAVVNLSDFSTGTVPNYGPQMLLDASVTLIKATDPGLRHEMKSGKKGRIDEYGTLFQGERELSTGDILSIEDVTRDFDASRQALVDHMEAFFGNATEFINSESPLLIDGLGIPDVGNLIDGRKVVVVSPGVDHEEQIEKIGNFIREYNPVIIGVEDAADTLIAKGYRPELLVGNPTNIASETLRSGARVILPADADGHAAGLERIQDLGVGAMTFPAATDSATDLALLLADFHDASLIVNVGLTLDLDAVFAARPEATPAALLTRTKLGSRLVDADAVVDLYTVPAKGGSGWLWAALGPLVALAAIVVVIGVAGAGNFGENLTGTWDNIADTVTGWFN